MNRVRLVPVGPVSLDILDRLAARLARRLRTNCHVEEHPLDPAFAWEPIRAQFYSTAILERLTAHAHGDGTHILGVTEYDLYVPVLTFVFGEAQLSGSAALVSTCRLEENYYGLAPNPRLRDERLEKEALHELGHTLGLRHCQDWRCVMASTHAVERLDLKEPAYCPACTATVRR